MAMNEVRNRVGSSNTFLKYKQQSYWKKIPIKKKKKWIRPIMLPIKKQMLIEQNYKKLRSNFEFKKLNNKN